MTRLEQAEKTLTRVKAIAESQGIGGMLVDAVKKYFNDVYSFKTRNIDVITVPDGSVPAHEYRSDTYYVAEFNIGGKSAKEVFDRLHEQIDKLEHLAEGSITVGIRQKDITSLNFVYPEYYFGCYSLSCVDSEGNCWSIDPSSIKPVLVKAFEKTDKFANLKNLQGTGVPLTVKLTRDIGACHLNKDD